MKTYNIQSINFTGSAFELVRHMHKASRAKAATDAAWMAETARRMLLMSGTTIRYNNADNFVRDLERTGYLDTLINGD